MCTIRLVHTDLIGNRNVFSPNVAFNNRIYKKCPKKDVFLNNYSLCYCFFVKYLLECIRFLSSPFKAKCNLFSCIKTKSKQ